MTEATTTWTEAEIRAMDGPSLTRAAGALGLAPDETRSVGQKILRYLTALSAPPIPWEPHRDIVDAEGVFRQLRARGFTTSVVWLAEYQRGEAWASCGGNAVACVQWPRDVPTEALALLLCAVLAVGVVHPRLGEKHPGTYNVRKETE